MRTRKNNLFVDRYTRPVSHIGFAAALVLSEPSDMSAWDASQPHQVAALTPRYFWMNIQYGAALYGTKERGRESGITLIMVGQT